MGKRVAMMTVVLWAAVTVDVCWCFSSSRISSDDLVGENVKVKSEELKKDAAQITHGAKEMADWAHEKYKHFDDRSFGVEKENARKVAVRATDTMNTAASEASEYASKKTGEAADKAYEIAGRMKDFASENVYQVIRMVSEGSNEGGERLEKAMEYAMNGASNAYDETKQKMNMASNKAYKAKESIADAMTLGRSRAVDAYDMHSDWSDDDDADAITLGRSRAVDANDMHSDWSDDDDDHSKERIAHTSNNFDAYAHMASDWDSDIFYQTMLEAIDYGRSRISNAYEEAKRIINMGIDMAMEKGAYAKEATEKAMEHGKEGCNHVQDEAREQINIASNKAGRAMGNAINGDEMEAFEESVNQAGKAYKTAKEKMTGEAKAAYEDAKERLSKATGTVGDKTRKDKQEL